MDAVDGLAFFFGRGDHERDVNASDHQHTLFGFHFTIRDAGCTAFIGRDSARCQRAGKGAEHSTASGGNDIIERRGMGLGELIVRDAVMPGDSAMDAEEDGLRLAGKNGNAKRTLLAFNPDRRTVDDGIFGH
ncbi:MAG TPA: hypothetical protein VEG63_11415 [Candidatus Acidoferrales bacterium]|nr:hypothetical protein [Candidatus Acidoferrales bacterium]